MNTLARCYSVRDFVVCCECTTLEWTCAVNYTCPITPLNTYNYAWLISLLIVGSLLLLSITLYFHLKRNRRMYDEIGVEPLSPRVHAVLPYLHSIRNWFARIGLFGIRVSDEIPLRAFDHL